MIKINHGSTTSEGKQEGSVNRFIRMRICPILISDTVIAGNHLDYRNHKGTCLVTSVATGFALAIYQPIPNPVALHRPELEFPVDNHLTSG